MLQLIRCLVDNNDNDNFEENHGIIEGDCKEGKSIDPPPRTVHLANIGGGRGDLANAVAVHFAHPHVWQRIAARVTVMDNNKSSLAAERKRLLAINLDKHILFVLCDLSKEEKVDKVLGDAGRFNLVFSLHCCGGLAETAVELAL